MSAKSLAKYPQGSILRDILHPLGTAGAGTSAPPVVKGARNGD
jgi:hypothetical protein